VDNELIEQTFLKMRKLAIETEGSINPEITEVLRQGADIMLSLYAHVSLVDLVTQGKHSKAIPKLMDAIFGEGHGYAQKEN
jgi:hypothetical protein